MSSDATSPAARRILEAAEELFYGHGIAAVGVDLVAERSGVTKRTLYNRFGSKDGLVTAYLTERDARWRAVVRGAVEACDDSVEAVLAPFEAMRTWSATNARGCALLNAIAELPDPGHPARAVAEAQKTWLRELFEQLARDAGHASPALLAGHLLILHEGALAMQPLAPETLVTATDLARGLVTD